MAKGINTRPMTKDYKDYNGPSPRPPPAIDLWHGVSVEIISTVKSSHVCPGFSWVFASLSARITQGLGAALTPLDTIDKWKIRSNICLRLKDNQYKIKGIIK